MKNPFSGDQPQITHIFGLVGLIVMVLFDAPKWLIITMLSVVLMLNIVHIIYNKIVDRITYDHD